MNKLFVKLGDIYLDNPIIPASGTFGFGYEFVKFYDINVLGSIAIKSITKESRFGNLTPRIAECSSGMLNAVGLQNPGIDVFVNKENDKIKNIFNKKIIASVAGFSKEEYVYVAKKFDKLDNVLILEINLSCPNIEENGITFASSKKTVYEICIAIKKEVKKPVFIKLSPNVTNIVDIALVAQNAGADGLVICNTLLGMVLDVKTGKPIISTKIAGFSGRAINPIALRMIYQVYKKIKIPIVGVGGISSSDDVINFMSAGASAVQIGSENFINPFICKEIIEELPVKLEEYNIKDLFSIIGRSHKYS